MLDHTAWKYQLQSALLGFEPAIASFSTGPAIALSELGNSVDALVAYKEFGGVFTEVLAQRGNLNALSRAIFNYSNTPSRASSLLGFHLLPLVPARGLMYGYVREANLLRQEAASPGSSANWATPRGAVTNLEATISEPDRAWARQMADQMLATFDASVFAPQAPKTDSEVPKSHMDEIDSFCRE